MALFVPFKSKRPHHSKITKRIQAYAEIAVLMKKSQFRNRSEHMHSPNPVSKFTGFILYMLEGRSKSRKETIACYLPRRIADDSLPPVGGPYGFCEKTQFI